MSFFLSESYFCFFSLIFSLLAIRTHSSNISLRNYHYPKIEELYPLPDNDQAQIIAAQFNQNDIWELGNMPVSLTEEEETTPIEPDPGKLPTGPGIIKHGHRFHTDDMKAYPIDREGVHPRTEHHVFVTRHGLYLNTEDEPTSHLLRYGKYQARMAGNKINQKIQEILGQSGPLTQPIRLVSSTQTRAFETLYNIRLQLSNELRFETEIIQDSGLTESTDPNTQRMRWLYFVREYLQPIKSKHREHTITIIASHGNLLTVFDHIIQDILNTGDAQPDLSTVELPSGVRFLHAQTFLYRSIGSTPISFEERYVMDEIPITVNHAQLRSDFYYAWAALYRCQSDHGRAEMENYIRATTLDNIFSPHNFENRIQDYAAIVYLEFVHEYQTHILPMLMHTCRKYLYRLPFIQANANFGSFNRHTSPVPLASAEEQRLPLDIAFYDFSAYSMPFRVDNSIQKFRMNPHIRRPTVPRGAVHPDSRTLLFLVRHDNLNVDTGDERTSYLTRLGINQIRGVMSHVNAAIQAYMTRASKNTQIYPINIVSEPSIPAAESAFHIRSLLIDGNYNVSEQITDLGLQFNYFRRRSVDDFISYQQVQVLYMLRRYFTPDDNNGTHPTLRIHILCGDGRLFTAFRRELAIANLLVRPYTIFSTFTDPGFNALKHANTFFFESIGDDAYRIHDTFTLSDARGIPDEYKIATSEPLKLSRSELKRWLRSASGPCNIFYWLENKDHLVTTIANVPRIYQFHIARVLAQEWHPYLAGIFIYACRYQLTLSGICNSYQRQMEENVQCSKPVATSESASGTHV